MSLFQVLLLRISGAHNAVPERRWCGSRKLPLNTNIHVVHMHTMFTANGFVKDFLKRLNNIRQAQLSFLYASHIINKNSFA